MVVCAQAQTAHAWITNAGSQTAQPDQNLSSAAAASQCITLNPATTYQTIDGFGWMLTEASAKLIKSRLFTNVRSELLNELYGPDGLNASIVRIAIGASDLSESDYTYSPAKDETLSNFSLAGPDADYLIPVLKEIVAINPNIKIMAVPWTAPVWMKSGAGGYNGYMGGTLNTAYYDAYARYFLKYLQAMEAEGLHVWAITPQNEPLHGGNNPSMTFTKETEYTFVDQYLGPTLEAGGFGHVKIICYDHNCDNVDFPIYVSRSRYVSGSAFHLYGGNISALKTCYENSHKDVYFTEQYTGANGSPAGDFTWHMQNVMLGSVNNYSRCAIEWNLAADANYGPHNAGGCSDCKGALTIGNNAITSRNVSYYIVGAMSKVVMSGALRIASSGANQFKYAAFHNPDGSIAVVAYNNGSSQQSLTVKLNGQTASWQVPSGAALSVLIPDAADPFETALESVEQTQLNPDEPMYDILGQRAGKDYRGIVIQNGHKFLLQ